MGMDRGRKKERGRLKTILDVLDNKDEIQREREVAHAPR